MPPENASALPRPESIHVLVTARSAEMAAGFAGLLGDQPGLVATISSGPVVVSLRACTRSRPDVVVIDCEPWPEGLAGGVGFLKTLVPRPAIYALAHRVDAFVRWQGKVAGVDEVFDRATELPRLIATISARSQPRGERRESR